MIIIIIINTIIITHLQIGQEFTSKWEWHRMQLIIVIFILKLDNNNNNNNLQKMSAFSWASCVITANATLFVSSLYNNNNNNKNHEDNNNIINYEYLLLLLLLYHLQWKSSYSISSLSLLIASVKVSVIELYLKSFIILCNFKIPFNNN